MPHAVQVLCLSLFAVLIHLVAMAQPLPPLKCVTFNLLHGGVFSGLRGNAQNLDRRLDLVVEELRTLGADVIGVQEASWSRGRGNVAERLAARLGFHHVYAPAGFRLFPSELLNGMVATVMNLTEGPAIISRFPIASWQAYDLPRCGRFTDPRVLLCTELRTPSGPLQACSTHTSGNLCQHKSVVNIIRERRGPLPVLLMGDFNAPEHSPAITALTQEAGFVDTFRSVNPGAPGLTVWQNVEVSRSTVFRRVDYVFLVPGTETTGQVLSSRVILDTPRQFPGGQMVWPSDHYGVLTEVEVFSPTG